MKLPNVTNELPTRLSMDVAGTIEVLRNRPGHQIVDWLKCNGTPVSADEAIEYLQSLLEDGITKITG